MNVWVPLIAEVILKDIRNGTLKRPKYLDEIDKLISKSTKSFLNINIKKRYPKTFRQIKYLVITGIKEMIQNDQKEIN